MVVVVMMVVPVVDLIPKEEEKPLSYLVRFHYLPSGISVNRGNCRERLHVLKSPGAFVDSVYIHIYTCLPAWFKQRT